MDKTSTSLDFLVKRIVEEVDPLRIIVFGSTSRGDVRPDSDIDLMVVMPEGVHKRRTAQLLYKNIRNVGVPFDILVTTEKDLERHRDNVGLIYKTVLEEGREIYAS